MSRSTNRKELAEATKQYSLQLFEGTGFFESIEEAIQECGVGEKRRCALRAVLMVWLVVAMNLYRNLSIPNVFRQLILWLRQQRKARGLSLRAVTDEAVHKGRGRLGVDVIRCLFRKLAAKIAWVDTFHGFNVSGIDGVRFSTPDTKDNEDAFGRPKASFGITAFPVILAVTLISTATRLVRDVVFTRSDESELTGAVQLLDNLGEKDLVLLDRGFHALWFFLEILKRGAHLVCRVTARIRPRLLLEFAPGDYLVEISGYVNCGLFETSRKDYKRKKQYLVMRMIEYRVGNGEVVRLFTSLLDPVLYPAHELALLYHRRWECEIANDEFKIHLAAVGGGALDLPFRSKSGELLLQEAYGLFTAYNLVRLQMVNAATDHNVPVLELSFVDCLQLIRFSMPFAQIASGKRLKELQTQLLADLAGCRMPRSRRNRRYPRVVRRKIVRFQRKQPHHHEERFDYAAQTRLTASTLPFKKAA